MSKWRPLCLAVVLALPVARTSHAQVSVFEALVNVFGQPASFDQCPQFFANATPPRVPTRPQQRELCCEAFAILHSGQSRTPVYVAQRLNRAAIEAQGAQVKYLPPYSPDLNPIEQVFAKLKAMLRRAQARTVEGLWSRIGDLLEHFTPEECKRYLSHCGYC